VQRRIRQANPHSERGRFNVVRTWYHGRPSAGNQRDRAVEVRIVRGPLNAIELMLLAVAIAGVGQRAESDDQVMTCAAHEPAAPCEERRSRELLDASCSTRAGCGGPRPMVDPSPGRVGSRDVVGEREESAELRGAVMATPCVGWSCSTSE
jgi:hypothetical protein